LLQLEDLRLLAEMGNPALHSDVEYKQLTGDRTILPIVDGPPVDHDVEGETDDEVVVPPVLLAPSLHAALGAAVVLPEALGRRMSRVYFDNLSHSSGEQRGMVTCPYHAHCSKNVKVKFFGL
jgi:hypothetical protein